VQSWGGAVYALFQVVVYLLQQGWLELDEMSSQTFMSYVLSQDDGRLQVVDLFIFLVCVQPARKTFATVRAPPPQCTPQVRMERVS